MKRKIEHPLKTNAVLNRLYTFFGSMLVKILGIFLTQEKGTILFVSYMGKNFNDSPKMIYDALLNDETFNGFTFIWAFTDPNKFAVGKSTRTVKMDSLKYLITALKAEFWVTNVNIERGLHFKKSYTTYINTWHGIPLKKIGNDVKGRSDFDFSTVDLFCYSGDFEHPIYKTAFKLSDRNLCKFGMPRNDMVLKNEVSVREMVRKKYNVGDK